MKNAIIALTLLATTLPSLATINIEKLWEKSSAQGNLMEKFETSNLKLQTSFAVANDTIYLQSRADAVAYQYDAEGNYLNSSLTETTGMRFIEADANGTLVGFVMANKGKSLVVKYYDKATATWHEFADTIKGNYEIQNPAIYGSVTGKFSVFIFDYNTTANVDYNIYRYTFQNGTLQKTETFVFNTSVALSQFSNIYPTSHDAFYLTVFCNGVYYVPNFSDTKITTIKDAATCKTDSLYSCVGGKYFSFKGKNYLVIPFYRKGESKVRGLGQFRIYDVTSGFERIYQNLEQLGTSVDAISTDYYINPVRIVTKGDGVYIYVMSPYNGMVVYKLTDDADYTPTAIEPIAKKNAECYVSNGNLHIVCAAGETISLYAIDGRLLTTTQAQNELTTFENVSNNLVIVKVGNTAQLVALQ